MFRKRDPCKCFGWKAPRTSVQALRRERTERVEDEDVTMVEREEEMEAVVAVAVAAPRARPRAIAKEEVQAACAPVFPDSKKKENKAIAFLNTSQKSEEAQDWGEYSAEHGQARARLGSA